MRLHPRRGKGAVACATITALAAIVLVPGCRADPRTAGPIKEVPHHGFRDDIPDDRRGNATFEAAAFSHDGAFLVTVHLVGGLRVWDGRTGALLSHPNAMRNGNDRWIVDGSSARLVARQSGQSGLALFDLRTGVIAGRIPEPVDTPAVMLGLGPGRTVIIARPGVFEAWSLDSATLRASVASPYPRERYRPSCVGGVFATVNEKTCWEFSASGRWLAMAVTPADPPNTRSHFVLLDLQEGTTVPLALPDSATDQHLAAFAFSEDERRLAVGTDRGVWMRDLAASRWTSFTPGEHKRNRLLGAMGFADGGATLVALGDQMQVNALDVATGQRVGRHEPPFDDWEGDVRVSRNGERVVLYHYASDILEVVDGRTAERTGWICPYFCNRLHNPVAVAFAVSPDARIVAASHRYGAGLWDPATDRLIAPLNDPTLPPRRAR